MPLEMFPAEICKYMGWDYWTFLNQPDWFIETIIIQINAKGRYHKGLRDLNKKRSASNM